MWCPFLFSLLAGNIKGEILDNFQFPDPVIHYDTPFCSLEPLLETNAIVQCTNSSFANSICSYKCQEYGEELLSENGNKVP